MEKQELTKRYNQVKVKFENLIIKAIEEMIEKEKVWENSFQGGWLPHWHLGIRKYGLWAHYCALGPKGFDVTIYQDKSSRGLTGLDICEEEGRGEQIVVTFPYELFNMSGVIAREVIFSPDLEHDDEILAEFFLEKEEDRRRYGAYIALNDTYQFAGYYTSEKEFRLIKNELLKYKDIIGIDECEIQKLVKDLKKSKKEYKARRKLQRLMEKIAFA